MRKYIAIVVWNSFTSQTEARREGGYAEIRFLIGGFEKDNDSANICSESTELSEANAAY